MKIVKIEKTQVLKIHEKLVEDAENSSDTDPISPSGVKFEHLLESGIHVQDTGYDGKKKYNDSIHCASALTYSLVTNHPFHNGNKRTALVTLLAHLDLNRYQFKQTVTENHLFCLFVSCASHCLSNFCKCENENDIVNLKQKIIKERGANFNKLVKVDKRDMDEEVNLIRGWLRKNTRKFDQSEKSLKSSELTKVLKKFGVEIEYDLKRQRVTLRRKKENAGFFTSKEKIVLKIKIRDKGEKILKKEIVKIRSALKLTEEFGIDSKSFYYNDDFIYDEFIRKYRTVIRELSHH